MKHILKILVVVVILVALGVTVSPLVIGHHLKKNYQTLLNKIPNRDAKLTVTHYDRGWYTDHVTVNVDFSHSGWSLNNHSHITLKQLIHHGPIIRQRNGGYGWQLARIDSHATTPGVFYRSTIMVDLHQHIQTEDHIKHADFQKAATRGQLIKFSSTMNFSKSDFHLRSTMAHVAFYNTGNKAHQPFFEANQMKVTHAKKMEANGDFKQAQDVKAGQLYWEHKFFDTLRAHDFQLRTHISQKGKKLQMHYALYADSLSLGDHPQRSYDIDFTLKNLDASLAETLGNELHFTPKNMQKHGVLGLIKDLTLLLHHGLSVDIDHLRFSTPNGTVSFSGKAALQPSDNPLDALQPLARLQAELEAKVPRKWFQAQIREHIPATDGTNHAVLAEREITHWIREGFVTPSKGYLHFTLRYQKGRFYLAAKDGKLTRFYWFSPPKVRSAKLKPSLHLRGIHVLL